MAVQVPCGRLFGGCKNDIGNYNILSHSARCLYPSTASASDAFSAYAIEETNRCLFFMVQVPAGCLFFMVGPIG